MLQSINNLYLPDFTPTRPDTPTKTRFTALELAYDLTSRLLKKSWLDAKGYDKYQAEALSSKPGHVQIDLKKGSRRVATLTFTLDEAAQVLTLDKTRITNEVLYNFTGMFPGRKFSVLDIRKWATYTGG